MSGGDDFAEFNAPEGQIWVCGGCGKTAKNRVEGTRGWDESCFLNAVLCYEEKGPKGKWMSVSEPTIPVTPGGSEEK